LTCKIEDGETENKDDHETNEKLEKITIEGIGHGGSIAEIWQHKNHPCEAVFVSLDFEVLSLRRTE
jgi:hypothetical protein